MYVYGLHGEVKHNNKCAMPCLCCGSPSVVYYFTKLNSHGEFPIMRCRACKSAFVWPRPDKDKMSAYYQDNSYGLLTHEEAVQVDKGYYPDSKMDSKRITDRCKKLTKGNRFLDVGAGFGLFSQAAVENGFDVSACEPNPNARKVFLQVNKFAADPCMFDRKYAMNHEEKFDVVLLSQVLEHVSNPEKVVQNISTVLDKDGIAVIAVPHFGSVLSKIQGKNDMYISPPDHLNFFSSKGLITLFARNNFKLEFFETVTKVPRGRIEEAIGISPLSLIAWRSLYGFLKFFEMFSKGMVLNAYFRKIE